MRTFTGEEFENEVIRICRSLYSNSAGQGAQKIDGRERDGVFWNGEYYTIIEATTDKKKDKAAIDAKKTHDLVTKYRQAENMAQGFIVTLHEPTADQRDVVKKYSKTTKIISFDELRSKLFDAASYLRVRSDRAFGSIYDHVKHTYQVPRRDFVEPTITSSSNGAAISITEIVDRALSSDRSILTAEYGVGKSMLLREIYYKLSERFARSETLRFPVAINLREHLGQSDPAELLERHARNVAADPKGLVAAWLAGHVDLIIDGFDELSTRGWTGDPRKLRDFKRSTHTVVKSLIRQTPVRSSIIIAGRAAYFDSEREMREALGTPEATFQHFNVHPFDSEQAAKFLRMKGNQSEIPQWLPTRPLFLSYLIGKNIISDAVSISSKGSFPEGAAWSALLDMIAGRESEQSEGVDKESILQFWGILSTKARQGNPLQKSFSPTEMDDAFYLATGSNVNEDERRLLLRLPGLGISSDNESHRTFIDADFLNAASARLVVSHLRHPFDSQISDELRNVTCQLNLVGTHVICSSVDSEGIPFGQLSACVEREVSNKNYRLGFDLYMPSMFIEKIDHFMIFEGIDIDELDICADIWDNAKVDFSNCLISSLILPPDGQISRDIHFSECLIGNIDGRASSRDLPSDNFAGCEVSNFLSSYLVNNEILSSQLSIGVRVLVVTLRKIYAQYGTSRLESALLRGLDHRSRMIAPEVIGLLKKHQFIMEGGRQGKTIYVGTRSKRREALDIIQSPATSKSAILNDCRSLS